MHCDIPPCHLASPENGIQSSDTHTYVTCAAGREHVTDTLVKQMSMTQSLLACTCTVHATHTISAGKCSKVSLTAQQLLHALVAHNVKSNSLSPLAKLRWSHLCVIDSALCLCLQGDILGWSPPARLRLPSSPGPPCRPPLPRPPSERKLWPT